MLLFSVGSGAWAASAPSPTSRPGEAKLVCSALLGSVDNFAVALNRSKIKLSEYLGEPVEIEFSPLTDIKDRYYPHEVQLSLIVGDKRVPVSRSEFRYRIDGDSISFNINVQEEFKNKGLSSVVHAFILRRHPHIQRMADALIDENLAGFNSFFLGLQSQPNFSYQATKTKIEEIRALLATDRGKAEVKDRILRAYRDYTATGRINENFGFRNIERIEVRLSPSEATFEYSAKFGQYDKDNVQIIVHDPERGKISL